jgi:hypothetical protein
LHAQDAINYVQYPEQIVQLALYPNPASSELNLQLLEPLSDSYSISIWSNSAQKKWEAAFDADAATGLLTIDVRDWAPGLYMVLLRSSSTQIVQSVIISTE